MLLFTYGTLMRGGCRHHLLEQERFVGPCVTAPLYHLWHEPDYPCMRPARGGETPQSVPGELYEIDEAILPRLDEAEGAPDWFRLGPVTLRDHPGPAWAYFIQR
jgi:gamma-glutamylcyclotransferase (GGCT)/AIG2-like uncharacterized protein YtfP